MKRCIKLTVIQTGPRFTQAEMDAEKRLWAKVIPAIDAGAKLKELEKILRAHKRTERKNKKNKKRREIK